MLLHALAFVLLAAAPLPVPEASALAAAEAEVQEVFGRELAAARKPADRAALARKMLDTAEGSRPAARYALLVRARELAIAAKDSAVGVEAVEGLAGFAGQSDAAEGHRLWAAARDLAGKLAAAEVYLRALPGLKGFERAAVEKRLRELGWPAKRFLPPRRVVGLFAIPKAQIDDEVVQWNDTSGSAGLWTQEPIGRQPLLFGFQIQAKHRHLIRAEIGGEGYVLSVGHGGNTYTLFATNEGGTFRKIRLSDTRVDSADKWHSLAVQLEDGKVRFYYDDAVVLVANQPKGAHPQSKIRVGFGDHGTDVSIRRVYVTSAKPPQ